jgi:hypothetical protein
LKSNVYQYRINYYGVGYIGDWRKNVWQPEFRIKEEGYLSRKYYAFRVLKPRRKVFSRVYLHCFAMSMISPDIRVSVAP